MLSFHDWLILTLTCLAGAASPGPSVILLIRSVTSAGVLAGLIFGISHGVGIFIYAGLVSLGLASLLVLMPAVFVTVQIAGVLFLLWIGLSMMREGVSGHASLWDQKTVSGQLWRHGRDGFLIAFLNPKVAVFFTAVFSQFLAPDQPLGMRVQMTATAWAVDSLWYMLLAVVFGIPWVLNGFRQHAPRLHLIMGGGLMLLAVIIGAALIVDFLG
ncbi:MAG: LysE family translocator [Proteobacteria bacterium]|jgi:threonine/homoserine/homoserine lactone efflux protein|nr:LysE family translocator [Pseudomonadota bacterium]MDA0908303.1 LysE family translocator [Pseudomonadota bacterium]MDC1020188.1 LysE family translocator [Alphaproteobacteria bacterium]NBR40489.1 LysE family translocator [Alphaproteobacteria bacterium]